MSGDVIQCLLKFASVAPENVAIMLLRTVAGLLTFQSRLVEQIKCNFLNMTFVSNTIEMSLPYIEYNSSIQLQ